MAAQNSGKEKTQWSVHVDVTSIVIVLALLGGGYAAVRYFQNLHKEEVVAARVAKEKREADEAEASRLNLEKQKQLEADRKIEKAARDEERKKNEETARQAFQLIQEKKELQKKEYLAKQDAERKQAKDEMEKRRSENQARIGAQGMKDLREVQQAIADDIQQIDEANKMIEGSQGKMIAYKNRIEVNAKLLQDARSNLHKMQSEQGKRASGTVAVITDNREQITQLSRKIDSLQKEYDDSSDGYARLELDRNAAESKIKALRSEISELNIRIKELGGSAIAVKPGSSATGTAIPPPSSAVRIYILKDGRRVRVVKAIEAGESLSVKTDKGAFDSFLKTDIVRIENE